MLKNFVSLVIRGALTLAAAILPIWIADYYKIATWNETSAFALRWDVLLITTLVLFLLIFLWNRLFNKGRHEAIQESSIPYSRLDRIVHNLAFGSSMLQNLLADFETRWSGEWADIPVSKPVFITSLPRSGTTIILETLNRIPGVATHSYRDMPFVLTPVAWSKLSAKFRKQSEHRERAHGDGLQVNEDSPEAFEEILWRKHYRKKYTKNGIQLWNASNEKFKDRFVDHIRKIIHLRSASAEKPDRYVSKNNANIARVETIKTMFDDAIILMPLRDPIEHASSMWRQHKNFTEQHEREPFVKKYMADIGHFEFGALHLPIQFPGLNKMTYEIQPDSINYWVAYWLAAYEFLATQKQVRILCYERFCALGAKGLTRVCEVIDLAASTEEIEFAVKILKKPSEKKSRTPKINQDLIKHSTELHNRLSEKCILKGLDG